MIHAQFINKVAEYVEQQISKVVLNGSHEITSFEVKQVNENTVVLNYFVMANEVSHISLIEMKDAANEVITSNVVDGPVTSDTMLLQTILVKEAN